MDVPEMRLGLRVRPVGCGTGLVVGERVGWWLVSFDVPQPFLCVPTNPDRPFTAVDGWFRMEELEVIENG